jgi:hypothetical protein
VIGLVLSLDVDTSEIDSPVCGEAGNQTNDASGYAFRLYKAAEIAGGGSPDATQTDPAALAKSAIKTAASRLTTSNRSGPAIL